MQSLWKCVIYYDSKKHFCYNYVSLKVTVIEIVPLDNTDILHKPNIYDFIWVSLDDKCYNSDQQNNT